MLLNFRSVHFWVPPNSSHAYDKSYGMQTVQRNLKSLRILELAWSKTKLWFALKCGPTTCQWAGTLPTLSTRNRLLCLNFSKGGGAQKEKETEAGAGQQGSSICALWLVSYAYSAPRPFLVPEGYAGDQGLTHFFALCAPAYSKQNAQNFMKNPKQCRQQRRESSKVLPKKKTERENFSLNFSQFSFYFWLVSAKDWVFFCSCLDYGALERSFVPTICRDFVLD